MSFPEIISIECERGKQNTSKENDRENGIYWSRRIEENRFM